MGIQRLVAYMRSHGEVYEGATNDTDDAETVIGAIRAHLAGDPDEALASDSLDRVLHNDDLDGASFGGDKSADEKATDL